MIESAVEAFPLQWPHGRPRTQVGRRTSSAFKTSFGKARDHIIAEVRRLGGSQTIISSNIPLRQDGLPYANFRPPEDSGVAVYFTYKKRQMCFACDRYRKAEDNIHAISLTIAALRGIARWGTGDMMEAAFTGFQSLPAPGQTSSSWRDVLGHDVTAENLDDRYRRLRSEHHPDKGGDSGAFHSVQKAYELAQQELARSTVH